MMHFACHTMKESNLSWELVCPLQNDRFIGWMYTMAHLKNERQTGHDISQ